MIIEWYMLHSTETELIKQQINYTVVQWKSKKLGVRPFWKRGWHGDITPRSQVRWSFKSSCRYDIAIKALQMYAVQMYKCARPSAKDCGVDTLFREDYSPFTEFWQSFITIDFYRDPIQALHDPTRSDSRDSLCNGYFLWKGDIITE